MKQSDKKSKSGKIKDEKVEIRKKKKKWQEIGKEGRVKR